VTLEFEVDLRGWNLAWASSKNVGDKTLAERSCSRRQGVYCFWKWRKM